MKQTLWLTLAVTFAAACTQTTPEMQVINDAVEALGGREAIASVNTMVMEGTATNANLGQNRGPEENLPGGNCCYDIKDFSRVVDLANGRARQQQTRINDRPTAVPQRQVQNFGLDGEIAFNVSADGQLTRQGERIASDRRAELILHHPIGIARAALDPAATLANARTVRNLEMVDITTAQGENLTLAIDSVTRLPSMVTSMAYHGVLGDVAIETAFADYQEVEGLRLPTRLTTKLDKYQLADISLTNQQINAAVADLAAPEAVTSAAVPQPTATVTVEELGKGLWYLTGQSHHSVLVEFSDHTELIEVPQNETRTLAVIAKARELQPDKPLTKAVVTHHHFDHTGGIRAATSEGLILVTHERNQELFEDLLQRRHSIVPDALANNPRPPQIETIGDAAVVKDAMRTMEIFHVDDSEIMHSESTLMVYFPAERILVQADSYNTANPNLPRLLGLNANIEKRKLRVDRHVPIHGSVQTRADYAKHLQAAKAAGTD